MGGNDTDGRRASCAHWKLPAALAAAVATLDIATPNGLAIPVLYVAIVPTLGRCRPRRRVFAFGVGLSLLTALGMFVGPSTLALERVLANRVMVMIALWGALTFLLTYQRNEDARTEERERANVILRQAMEAAPVGMVIVSEGGLIVGANRCLEQMFGYPEGSLAGTAIEELVPLPQRDEHGAHRARWMLDKRAHLMGRGHETRGLRRDGTTFPIEATLVSLESGMPLLTIQDLTEKRALAERLRATQRMEAIGRLAGGIAHDFNNLLAVMGTYGDLALDALDASHPARADVAEMVHAAARAGSLTAQLLAFSRQQVISPRRLDLGPLLTAMVRMLRRMLGPNIELSTETAPDLWQVEVDSAQLEQVLLNLAVNARDAMPSGGRITIDANNAALDEEYALLHPDVAPGEYVQITVADTGVGMTEQVRVRAFEPFFTTKEVGKGTGLGLATAYGIVRQAHGHIWLYSEPGRGTTFKIYLPRAEGPLKAATTRSSVPPRGGSETILLVEDEEPVRTGLGRVLRAAGYDVIEASNGADALLKCEAVGFRVHLALTDVVMPQMGGRELADRLSERAPQLPVVFMSGFTDNAIVHKGVLEEGLVFLQKPIKRETLLCRVRDVLDAVGNARPPID